jgi:hypothetical protein
MRESPLPKFFRDPVYFVRVWALIFAVMFAGFVVLVILSRREAWLLALAALFLLSQWVAVAWAARRTDFSVGWRRDWIPAVVPVVALVVSVLFVGSRTGTLQFHVVAAQIIPVLLLALMFQARIFQVSKALHIFSAMYLMLNLEMVAFGEFAALRSVFTETPQDAAIVVGAIGSLFVSMIVSAVSDPASASNNQ